LFTYQSLDAIDGKQARRTNSSTPLGELFDHGCDAVSTGIYKHNYPIYKLYFLSLFAIHRILVFVIMGLCVSLRLGLSPWFMFITVFLAMFAFYVAHWQTYVTGTLKFGKIDVTEAQLVTYSIFAISGIFGDYFWSLYVIYYIFK